MTIEILKDIIDEFEIEKFIRFFRDKNRSFKPRREELIQYNDKHFKNSLKLGEINFADEWQNLIVCSFGFTNSLTERSGKKVQYEKGKKILKELQYDAGIFIFYNQTGNFRFSLIYANYLGKRRDWSTFRRFTYFVSQNYTNKTFYQRIGAGDFSSLEKIKDAFSVEKVTKDFYKDIANWYFWAVQQSKFPKDAEVEENGRNIAIIRLITRLIFIWFMRERNLVPGVLFDKEKIKSYLKDLTPGETTYYKAILQNLFFATLSTKQKERKFGSEKRYNKGWNEDYGNQYVFRYHELFKNPEDLENYFAYIPFLNGGLFECLDDKHNGIIIDGFSRTKKNQPIVPNFLFFSDEEDADLNTEYGTKKKKYKVRGLINTLSSYNFTIDENEPDDAEVALDPELLGKVFENLLASFNPETASTARKATGSYYTPREIVDYMVTQSLKEYLKTHLKNVDRLDEKIDQLLKNQESKNPFTDNVSKEIVTLIDNLRIVDPAVGSGAFPMGILNKLTLILGKLDPDNILWKEAQIEAVKNSVTDPILRRDYLDQINEKFTNKNFDYGRKLYLIQKCIYGVDIQQIAVEIAKLRFFITLLVDEKINKAQENLGIEPLPNLDFKIMQGNSLISEFMGINFDDDIEKNNGRMFSDHQEVEELIDEFQQKKNEFQNEPDRDKKEKLKQEIDDLMIQIFETKLKEQKADYFGRLERIEEKYAALPNKQQREEIIAKEKQALSKREGFDLEKFELQLREFSGKNKVKPFFAWKLYFAEVFQGDNPGFDIVIANPPYGFRNVLTAEEKEYFRKQRNVQFPSGDIAELFILIALENLVKTSGIQTYIIPKKSLYGESWKNIRKLWVKNSLLYLMDASKAFENVLLEQISYSIVKTANINSFIEIGALDSKNEHVEVFGRFQIERIFSSELRNAQIYRGLYPKSLLYKILSNSITNTSKLICGKIGISNITSDLTFKHEGNYPCVKGIDIIKYGLKQDRYIKSNMAKKYLSLCSGDKIIAQEIVAHVQNPFPRIIITIFYDDSKRLFNDTCVEIKVLDQRLSKKFLLGYFQSIFCNWYAYNLVYNRAIRTMHFINYYLTQIPIPTSIIEDVETQEPIIVLVDKILTITKSDDYLQNPDNQTEVKKLEAQIDQLVYRLYSFTQEEIEIVGGNK